MKIISNMLFKAIYFYLFLLKTWSTNHWLQVPQGLSQWAARNGHATAILKDAVWLTGGRSNSYKAYNLQSTQRRGDVWFYKDGDSAWTQVANLKGNFSLQNWDALHEGYLAPWYARFGHTLTTYNNLKDEVTGQTEECMLLIGGFSPKPINDVWITMDGVTWIFVQNAPFSGRAWHSTIVLHNRIFVVGGTPLNNEVWVTDYVKRTGIAQYSTNWRQLTEVGGGQPWFPRAGFGLVVQNRTAYANCTEPFGETLFLYGGYGGWPSTDPRFDGIRARNDVWRSQDGVHWELLVDEAPWKPRAWMGTTVWHSLTDSTWDVLDSTEVGVLAPRIWITGGGYMGQRGNNIVSTMIAKVDTWWSRDGIHWVEVSDVQGAGSDLSSTEEWASTQVLGVNLDIGKWGHSLIPFKRTADVPDNNGVLVPTVIPTMLLSGGSYVDMGALDNRAFYVDNGVLCHFQGVECNGEGTCLAGVQGCICNSDMWMGEFCNVINPNYFAAAAVLRTHVFVMLCSLCAVVFTHLD